MDDDTQEMKVTLYEVLKSEGWVSMERYAESLNHELFKLPDLKTSLFCPEIKNLPISLKSLARFTPTPWLFAYPERFILYPLKAQSAQGDINHITDHSYSHVVHWLDPKRTIVSCHDLIPLRFEQDKLTLKIYMQAISGLRKCAFIIASSESTKKDLIEFLNIPPEKIEVNLLGVESRFKPSLVEEKRDIKNKYGIPDGKILLQVGSSQSSKNIEVILNALSEIDATFIKVGADLTREQRKILEKNRVTNKYKYIGKVPDWDLPVIYSIADILLMPSFYEGFGLPVIESFSCGTPVICSKKGSLPEVGGDLAVYLKDETNPEELICAVREILSLSVVAKDKIAGEAMKWAKSFSWAKNAEKTHLIYKDLMAKL